MTELNFSMTDSVVRIENSYLIPKRQIRSIIRSLKESHPDNAVLKNRSEWLLVMELAAHDFLYKLGIARSRTKDVDWDYPQPFWFKIGYAIFGPISWLFID